MMAHEEPPASERELDSSENVIPISRAKPKDAKAKRVLAAWEQTLLERLSLSEKTNTKTGETTYSIRTTPANLATVLQLHASWSGVIAKNEFHLRIETTRVPPWNELDMPSDPKAGPWTDGDTARGVNWFARNWICDMPPINVGPKTIEAAVLVAAEANTFHPVREYLYRVRDAWDGDQRIDTWIANYLGGELTPYARAAGVAFLVGLVARVMRPGCKHDSMLVLEGNQGKYKSTALETLTSPWFADSRLPIGEKDGLQMLAGVWLWEIGELAGLSKADVETVKAFLSSRTDRYRPSYGKHTIDVPRQTAFAGTTNAGTYLQDATGGRRFNPLRTSTIKIPELARDRDQLWGEAVHRFEAGAKWWVEESIAAPEQSARFVTDEWEEPIRGFLRDTTHTTVRQILGSLIFAELDKDGMVKNSMGKWGQREQNRVVRCLTAIGWTRRQVRVKGSDRREWRYVSPLFDPVTTLADREVT